MEHNIILAMSTPNQTDVTYILLQILDAIDDGDNPNAQDTWDAFEKGEAMKYLNQFNRIDLSIYKQGSSNTSWGAMNDLFKDNLVDRPSRLGVQNNGLVFAAAQAAALIDGGTWKTSGSNIKAKDLEFVSY